MEKFYLSLFNKYTNTSLVVLLLIISFFAYSAKDFQLDASSDTLILEQDEDLKKYRSSKNKEKIYATLLTIILLTLIIFSIS